MNKIKGRTNIDRLYQNIEFIPFHGCWEWTGNKNHFGYGRIQIDKKSHRAHRLSWEIHRGEIPQGLIACHKCDNPGCVNPDHLFLGTDADNVLDRNKKGRANMPHGSAHHLAKLKEDDVKFIRNSGLSSRKLSKVFGVSHKTILNAKSKGWVHA